MNKRTLWTVAAVVVLAGAAGLPSARPTASRTGEPASAASGGPSGNGNGMLSERLAGLRLPFIANEGQVANPEVQYYARCFGGTVFVSREGEIYYALTRPAAPEGSLSGGRGAMGWTLKERLVAALAAVPEGIEKAGAQVSYYLGTDPQRWHQGMATYASVSLGQVYRGIELSVRANGDSVEKVFTVEPGADPGAIRIAVDGAQGLSVVESGELEAQTGLGAVRFSRPLAYQERGGEREYVDAGYHLEGDSYGFAVGPYDRSRPLIVDPLLASTFVGGGDYERATSLAMAKDGSGDVYIAGHTSSSDFPVTTGVYSKTLSLLDYAFVCRLSAGLNQLEASSFIGGRSGSEQALAMTVDAGGSIYLAGYTTSTDFPTTTLAFGGTPGAMADVFVAKLGSDLALQAATLLVGGGTDWGQEVAVAGESVYVAGHTDSTDYPTTEGAYSRTNRGFEDVFVSRLSADLTILQASTYLGGANTDKDVSMVIDGTSGAVYVAGTTLETGSPSTDFPTTGGAYQTTHGGGFDGFVCKLTADLGATGFASTLLGGSGDDYPKAIALYDGQVCVAGFLETAGNVRDAFVCALDPALTSMPVSTSLAWNGDDYAYALVPDGGGIYVAGSTSSTNLPAGIESYHSHSHGNRDAFIARLDAGLLITACTYIGGALDDEAFALAPDGLGNVYIAGYSASDNFPVRGAYDYSHHEGWDVIVAKLTGDLSADVPGPIRKVWLPIVLRN